MDGDRIRRSIEDGLSERGDMPPNVVSDVAFHMTDWLEDLQSLVQFYERPDSLTAGQIDDLLGRLLVHAPNHLAAAAKLYSGEPLDDVFGIGATIGTGQPADGHPEGSRPLLPAGGHTSYECGWERNGERLTLWCPLHLGLLDLGTFEVRTSLQTRFTVNGVDCSMDDALSQYNQLSGETVLIVGEPGLLDVMMFRTGTEG